MNFFGNFLRAFLRLRSENVILSADRVVERKGRRTRVVRTLLKWRRSKANYVKGPVDVLSHVRTRARSLHFGQ